MQGTIHKVSLIYPLLGQITSLDWFITSLEIHQKYLSSRLTLNYVQFTHRSMNTMPKQRQKIKMNLKNCITKLKLSF